jgi:digeranylgeranylglycerophospholipid reductase
MFHVKVAIVGGGVAGLCCAIELERHGENPIIFEKKSFLGDVFDLNAWIFNDLKNQGKDPLVLLRDKFQIELKPNQTIQKIIQYDQGKQKDLKGDFGTILKRGMEKESLGNQLAKMFSGKVHFDTYIYDVDELIHQYDKIIVATGNPNIAKSLQMWKPTSFYRVKMATVLGAFDTRAVVFWRDPNFSKDGFAYLIANSEKEAIITLVVNEVSYSEMEFYWKKFLSVSGFDYKIIEINDVDFPVGVMKKHTAEDRYPKEKIFFIGNARATKDHFLGDGLVETIENGVQTARKILGMG